MKKHFAIILIVLSSCERKSESLRIFDMNPSAIQIADTLFTDFPYFKFAAKFGEDMVGYNPYNNDVILVDLEEINYSIFNKFGTGPENYQLLFNNIGFSQKEEVIIGGFKELKIYDKNGNFIRDLPVARGSSFAPIIKPFGYQNSIYAVNLPQGSSSSPSFFSKHHELLIKFNEDGSETKLIQEFLFKKLNKHNGYYPYNGLTVSFNDGNKFYLMDQNEAVLRIFNLETQVEEQSIMLDLKYFQPNLLPYKKQFTKEELKLISSMNSMIYGIFVQDDLIFVIYDIAYTEDEFYDFINSTPNDSENIIPPIRYVIHVSDQEGKRIMDDFLIPDDFGVPIAIQGNYILSLKEGDTKNLLLRLKYPIHEN